MEARSVRVRERGSGACFARMRRRGCCRIKYIPVCECATTAVPRRDASAARAQGLSAARSGGGCCSSVVCSRRRRDRRPIQCGRHHHFRRRPPPRLSRAADDQPADAIADDTPRRPSPVNKLAAKPTGKPLRVRMRACAAEVPLLGRRGRVGGLRNGRGRAVESVHCAPRARRRRARSDRRPPRRPVRPIASSVASGGGKGTQPHGRVRSHGAASRGKHGRGQRAVGTGHGCRTRGRPLRRGGAVLAAYRVRGSAGLSVFLLHVARSSTQQVNIEVHGPELVSFDDTIAAIADAVGCGNSCHVWDTVPCGDSVPGRPHCGCAGTRSHSTRCRRRRGATRSSGMGCRKSSQARRGCSAAMDTTMQRRNGVIGGRRCPVGVPMHA